MKSNYVSSGIAARILGTDRAVLAELAAGGRIECVAGQLYAVDSLAALRGGVAISESELRAALEADQRRREQYRTANRKRRPVRM